MKAIIDNEEILLVLFLDLSKAFNTLDHDVLIYKLEHKIQFVIVNGFKMRCAPGFHSWASGFISYLH